MVFEGPRLPSKIVFLVVGDLPHSHALSLLGLHPCSLKFSRDLTFFACNRPSFAPQNTQDGVLKHNVEFLEPPKKEGERK